MSSETSHTSFIHRKTFRSMMSQSLDERRSGDVTVVIDIGTGYLRGGVAGEDNPRCVLPTVLAFSEKEESRSDLQYPIDRGTVRNWEGVEHLFNTLYTRLHVQPDSRHALLLTRHVLDPVTDAERFVQMAVESLGANAVYLGSQPVLTLYANGRTDGVVLDCGEGVTQVVPIYEGYAIDHAIQRQDFAGRDVSSALQSSLAKRRPDNVQVDLETAREMKERLCYVAPNFDLEAEAASNKLTKSYTLPNEDVITVREARFQCPEVLFKPSLVGSEYMGLPRLVHKSISACPIDVRGQLYDKIIMAGGTTRLPGICRRLLNDVSKLTPTSRVKVVAGAGRQLSAWRGGCVLASLPCFPDMCISRQEFTEHGTAIVRKKLL